MQLRDVLFLLLLGLVGYFLWKRIQAVTTLATANQTSTAALSAKVDTLTQSNRSLSNQVTTLQTDVDDAPDYVAKFDALLGDTTPTVQLLTSQD